MYLSVVVVVVEVEVVEMSECVACKCGVYLCIRI